MTKAMEAAGLGEAANSFTNKLQGNQISAALVIIFCLIAAHLMKTGMQKSVAFGVGITLSIGFLKDGTAEGVVFDILGIAITVYGVAMHSFIPAKHKRAANAKKRAKK